MGFLPARKSLVLRNYSMPCHTGNWRAILLGAACVSMLAWNTGYSQDTPDFFKKNCMNCHTIGGGRLAGPDLKGLLERQSDREWLIAFMQDPKSKIDAGDEYARKIFEESNRVPMPVLPGMTRERCENLLKLIEEESAQTDETKLRFKGLKLSTRPLTDKDVAMGRAIFNGTHKLEAGGAACISCHSMNDTPLLGGGRLGGERTDLTNVFTRLKDRKTLSAWLASPAAEVMQPIFKDRELTPDEIDGLVAYFKEASDESQTQPATSRVTFMLMGLLGAVAIIFGFDAIWRRRFHSVRQPLIEATAIPQQKAVHE